VSVRSHASADTTWHALVSWVRSNTGAWVAFDSYELDHVAHRSIRASGARLLVIDDCAPHAEFDCDILVNQNIGAEDCGYRLDAATRCCLGPQFALLRSEFMRPARERRFDAPASRLVVTFGGADMQHQAARVARMLAGSKPPVD